MKTENFGTFLHTDHKNCYYCVKTNIFPESSTTAALLSHVPTQNFSSQILRSVYQAQINTPMTPFYGY